MVEEYFVVYLPVTNTLVPKDPQEAAALVKKLTAAYCATNFSGLNTIYPPVCTGDPVRGDEKFLSSAILPLPASAAHSIYLHFPFCSSKCSFCRQFSGAGAGSAHYREYVRLLCRELELYSGRLGNCALAGLYFGGGTPTLFDFERVFGTITEKFKLSSPYFLNMESTPYALTKEKLRALKRIGTTRLNIGVQSLDAQVLKAINRPVSQINILPEIYNEALRAGLDDIGLELVCGLPEQTPESFARDLDRLISLRPMGIDIYPFRRTPFTALYKKHGAMTEAEEELGRRMYRDGKESLKKAGYTHYGDDFAREPAHRNPHIYRNAPGGARSSCIPVGLSATGNLRFTGGKTLTLSNVRDWALYGELISRGLLPVERASLLSHDEILRARIIHLSLFGRMTRKDFPILCRDENFRLETILGMFPEEFGILKAAGKIKLSADLSEISWDPLDLDWFRLFYSPAVMEKCLCAGENKTLIAAFQTGFCVPA